MNTAAIPERAVRRLAVAAVDFLRCWEPAGPWVLTAIDPDTRRIETTTFYPREKITAARWIEDRQGEKNVYFSANRPRCSLTSKATKADIGEMLTLHADLDPRPGEDITEERVRIESALRTHSPPPSVITFSGNGYQGYWLLAEPQPVTDIEALEGYNRQLATTLGADHCHNIDRIMRLPATINLPDAKKRQLGRIAALARVVEADWDRRYRLDQFEPAAAQSKPNDQDSKIWPRNPLPSWCEGLIASGDATRWHGDRSAAVFCVVCEMVRCGCDDGEIVSVLLDPANGISSHVLDQSNPEKYAQRQAEQARVKVGTDRNNGMRDGAIVIDQRAPYTTAKLFLDQSFSSEGQRILHHHRGAFYRWNGSAYTEIAEAEQRSQLYAFLDRCCAADANGKQRPVKPTSAMVSNVLDALRAASHLDGAIAAPSWLDSVANSPAEDILACLNGLLHLPTLTLQSHTPAFFTYNALDFAFAPAALEPRQWLEFLGQLWPDDQQAIDTLQELFGYCLTGDTRQQKAFLLVGPKRSGKGTIARVLARLVGIGNAVAPTLAALGTNFGLAPLIGKRVAIISDARLGSRADQHAITERLLSITGEDAITIDRKYLPAWTGQLQTRFLVISNELPRLADASGALASRFIVLLLSKSFYGREDQTLTGKLLIELPGILNWSIAGWRRLTERGYFVQPRSALDAVQQLEELGSPIMAFVRECCEIGPFCSVGIDEFYQAWCGWCAEQGQAHPGVKQTFGRNLLAVIPGLRPIRPRDGKDRWRGYQGVGLR